jgi:tryptophanyl-tRNA synthetase
LHATTVFQEPKQFSQSTLKLASMLLACGLDPKKCSLYVQSHLTAHAELCWILGCITPVGWLTRMIQYKQKREQSGANLGLLSYPVLQAADVLLYR